MRAWLFEITWRAARSMSARLLAMVASSSAAARRGRTEKLATVRIMAVNEMALKRALLTKISTENSLWAYASIARPGKIASLRHLCPRPSVAEGSRPGLYALKASSEGPRAFELGLACRGRVNAMASPQGSRQNLVGAFAQLFWARLSCQCHQSTMPIASAAIEIKATIRADASIQAATGTQSAMMIPSRQICHETT